METVKYDEDNLIYNCFDLLYQNDFDKIEIVCQNLIYPIAVHLSGKSAVLNVWGKNLPASVFEQVIGKVFCNYEDIRYIEIERSINDYQRFLCKGNDVFIRLPETMGELLLRPKAKHRCSLNKEKRLLEEQCGPLSAVSYTENIPDSIVERYFAWKRESHGTDYGLLPQEYLRRYHVTDAILVKAGEQPIGIVFYCLVGDTAYLENFSYNNELNQYSPGYLSYVIFLEELIKRKCRLLYLGGGNYEYKKRFGAEERVVYSGSIYRQSVFEEVNHFFEKENIHRYAIYGLGTGGEEFLCVRAQLAAELVYGIDRNEKQIDILKTYTTDERLPEADAVLITLKSHNADAESFLKQRFAKVFYWEDMVKLEIFEQL